MKQWQSILSICIAFFIAKALRVVYIYIVESVSINQVCMKKKSFSKYIKSKAWLLISDYLNKKTLCFIWYKLSITKKAL